MPNYNTIFSLCGTLIRYGHWPCINRQRHISWNLHSLFAAFLKTNARFCCWLWRAFCAAPHKSAARLPLALLEHLQAHNEALHEMVLILLISVQIGRAVFAFGLCKKASFLYNQLGNFAFGTIRTHK